MARRLESDRILFGTIVVLVLFGIIMVFSASAVIAADQFHSGYYFVLRQTLWAVLGFGVMLVMMNVDYRRLKSPLLIFPALGLQLLLLLGVLFVKADHDTHRWIRLGPVTLQPSELSKIVLVIFLAYFLEQHKNSINDWRKTLLPVGLVAGLDAVLILREPDFGTTLAIAVIVGAMLFAAGLRLGYFVAAGLLSLPVLYYLIFHVGYRYRRILAFLHPYAHPLGAGFQIIQSYIAVGTGGITGAGLMEGKEKLFYLPEPQTDFIFAVIGEELGLIGAVLVLALFAVILWRGLRAAARCQNDFGRLLAIGLTSLVVIQSLVNISVVIGLLPTKGVPLPFVSYGGSSLVMSLFAMGILLNISQNTS
jgi:cell division protein FtsW